MRFRKSMPVSVGAVIAGLLASAGCVQAPPSGGAVPSVPEQTPGAQVPTDTVTGPLSASLSASRTQLIRDDAREGSAVVTATASRSALFEWDTRDLAALAAFEISTTGPATQSVLRILRITSDPGADGKEVILRVTVTPADEQADPVTRELRIRVVRPRAALAAIIDQAASSVAPRDQITFSARLSGGRPLANVTPACTPDQEQRVRIANDNPEALVPPNNGMAYNVAWELTLDDSLLSAESFATATCLMEGDGVVISQLVFTAPPKRGTLTAKVTVTDAAGASDSDSTAIVVSSTGALTPLQVGQAAAATPNIAPGDIVRLTAEATGGEPPFAIVFSLDPMGLGGSLSASGCPSSATGRCVLDYTATLNKVGSENITVTITDAVGDVVTGTITIAVAPLLDLDVTATSDSSGAQPKTTLTIQADLVGGVPPYTVCYIVKDADGDPFGTLASGAQGCESIKIGDTTFTNCTCNLGNPERQGVDLVTNTREYTAPATAGNANIRVAVRDAVNTLATALLTIPVASDQIDPDGSGAGPVSLSVTPPAQNVCFGFNKADAVTATASGGVTPYTFEFSIVEPKEAGEAIAPTSKTTTNSSEKASYTAHSAASITEALTHTLRVEVSEPGGSTAIQLVSVTTPGLPLADAGPDRLVCKDQGSLTVGGNPTATEGLPPYTYEWHVFDVTIGETELLPTGTYLIGPNTASPAFDIQQVVIDLPASTDFKVTVTVTDACGRTSAESAASSGTITIRPDCLVCTTNADCNDGNLCTDEACVTNLCVVTFVGCQNNDGCCLPGCNNNNDNDCPPVCGNGFVEAGEDCESGDCCDVTTCLFESGGTECRASSGTCDPAETCTGSNRNCPVDLKISTCGDGDGCCFAGCNNNNDDDCPAVCGNSIVETGEDCEAGDCCDLGTCQFEVAGTVCRAAVGTCNPAEECTGLSAACPADISINTCTDADGCCPAGCNNNNDDDCPTVCGNNIIEAGEDCESGDCCDLGTCLFEIVGTECRASTGACDPAEECTGIGAACPANITINTCTDGDGCCPPGCSNNNDDDCLADCGNGITEGNAGEECDDGNNVNTDACTNTCTLAFCGDGIIQTTPPNDKEDCDGGACCDNACIFVKANPATECRAAAGDCDVAEFCTGSSAACPADVLEPNGTECRASTGNCDPAETCTGGSAACPADDVITTCTDGDGCCPAGCNNGNDDDCMAVCGNNVVEPGEDCETGDCCDLGNCQFESAATECRASAGDCDVAESCTGSSAGCPADDVEPNTTECRASVDACDPAELCDGAGVDCLADVTITACTDGDGCCPAGCDNTNDSDCP